MARNRLVAAAFRRRRCRAHVRSRNGASPGRCPRQWASRSTQARDSSSTRAKYAGSRSGSKTPRQSQSEASTSPLTPSSNATCSRCLPTTSTSTIRCRWAAKSMLEMLRTGQLIPLANQAQSSGRSVSGDSIAGLDRDHDGVSGVRRVKVRHPVLAHEAPAVPLSVPSRKPRQRSRMGSATTRRFRGNATGRCRSGERGRGSAGRPSPCVGLKVIQS